MGPINPVGGIVVVNDTGGIINGDVTISGNINVESSGYGILLVNGYLGAATINGDVTISGNTVLAFDDGIGLYNGFDIFGDVTFSDNFIVSTIDDGVDFTNNGLVDGDVTITVNTIDTADDNVNDTNNGAITGTMNIQP